MAKQMSSSDFFREQRHNSRIKTEIVTAYFKPWAQIIRKLAGPQGKIGYLDLFAGPGSYEDGTPSTPTILLKSALKSPVLRQPLQVVLNDADPSSAEALKALILESGPTAAMQYPPIVTNLELGPDVILDLGPIDRCPTFFFIDPLWLQGPFLGVDSSGALHPGKRWSRVLQHECH